MISTASAVAGAGNLVMTFPSSAADRPGRQRTAWIVLSRSSGFLTGVVPVC
jgi:hypothetical protein